MQINPTINLNGVPLAQQPGFTAAVNAACSFYDQLFSNNVTLNVTFTYGPVSGGSAQNTAQGIYTNYATIRSELASNADTAVADTAVNTLSATDPTGGGTFFLTEAQAKALGMGSQLSHWGSVYGSPGNASAADGVVTLNSSVTWDYGTSGRAAPSQLDAIGALEHEISEVMGRNGIEGTGNLVYNQNNDTYTALDLFRYVQNASGGLTQTLAPGPGTFSFDGRTPTLTFNDPTILNSSGSPQGGDLTDWASFNPNQGGPVGDSYGQPLIDAANTVSQTDLEVMNVIGWQIVTPTVAQLQSLYAANPTSMELSVVDSAANVSSNFDALVSLAQNGAFNSISFTDLVPVLSLDNYQLTSDASLFPLIQGKYELSDKLSDIPLTFSLPSNVPYITLTGSGDATITGNALNDTYVVNAQGNHTIDPGDLGSDTIVSNAGTTTPRLYIGRRRPDRRCPEWRGRQARRYLDRHLQLRGPGFHRQRLGQHHLPRCFHRRRHLHRQRREKHARLFGEYRRGHHRSRERYGDERPCDNPAANVVAGQLQRHPDLCRRRVGQQHVRGHRHRRLYLHGSRGRQHAELFPG